MTDDVRRRAVFGAASLIVSFGLMQPWPVVAQTDHQRPQRKPRPASAEAAALVGQRLIVGFTGQHPEDDGVRSVHADLAEGLIAGVLLLKRNVASLAQLTQLCRFLASASPQRPPIIAIDQEGGLVARADPGAGFAPWLPAADVAITVRDEQGAFDYYFQRARELAFVGITLNLGPVVDLNVNRASPIIDALGRSYGRQPEEVIRFARAFVQAHRVAGIRTCLKHFPGHGSASGDSHRGPVDITRRWSSDELVPFGTLVTEGLADAIMTAHVHHPRFSDGPGVPVSLSTAAVREIRRGLGFDGLVITDDLQMAAVTQTSSEATAAIAATKAGADLLIYSTYDRPDAGLGHRINRILVEAADEGLLSRQALDASAARVTAFRTRMR